MPNNRPVNRIGVDFGGVLAKRRGGKDDTSFSENFLATPEVENAFESLARIVRHFGSPNVYMVSKCKPSTQEKTQAWLWHHSIYERTSLLPDNVRFCHNRADKAPIAAELGLTHFVDDRLEVLGYQRDIVPYRFLFDPDPQEVAQHREHAATVTQVNNWEAAWAAIRSTLR